MFAYCTEVLHLSEAEAYLRIAVARAARKYPMLLVMLGEGRLHLSGIAILAPHLTEENCQGILAQLAPPASARTEPLAPERYKVQFTASRQLRDKLPPPPFGLRRAFDEALAKSNQHLQELMEEDLAAVIEAAVTEKLERLEAKRYAQSRTPRKSLEQTDISPRSRYIPAAVRRVVWRRDGGQCGFVDQTGRRCTERRGLELHHHEPFGRGGAHDPNTISLRCRTHNAYLAERDYGKEEMYKYRRRDDRVSELAQVNQRHACGVGSTATLLKGRPPVLTDLYRKLETTVRSFGEVEVVTRDRYALFRTTRIFADLTVTWDALRVVVHLGCSVRHRRK
jgi:hypothetical protein